MASFTIPIEGKGRNSKLEKIKYIKQHCTENDIPKIISPILDDYKIRKLTPTECCRLQGFPDNYVSMVSNTQGYKALGNSFTVPVIKHIINQLNK